MTFSKTFKILATVSSFTPAVSFAAAPALPPIYAEYAASLEQLSVPMTLQTTSSSPLAANILATTDVPTVAAGLVFFVFVTFWLLHVYEVELNTKTLATKRRVNSRRRANCK